jgi:hypothetical protein
MSAGSARLNFALRTLRERWGETKAYWADQVARDFEKNHLHPLDDQSITAIRGMEKLAEVLQKVRQDCRGSNS